MIATGLSSSDIDDIWTNETDSKARIESNSIGVPINYTSVSEYYRLATSLVGVLTSSIQIDVKWNANTKLNRMVIMLNYTKK